MIKKANLQRIERLIRPYTVTSGRKFRLKDVDPGDTRKLGSDRKQEAKDLLAFGVEWLSREQEKLYAHDRWSVLLVFQAMDAAGKDGTIRHVMSGINPQGCQVFSFKQPSAEDLEHDYLWRYIRALPERGRIGIFNRSYYEEVLVVRVHQHILAAQKLPPEMVTADIWDQRLRDIAAFEEYLYRNGTIVLKFFLHVSRDEQKKRFMERLDTPQKNWKFSPSDIAERQYWPRYMEAYEAAIRATATRHAPWYVVPADNKWFTRLVVAAAIVQRMELMNLAFPTIDAAKREALAVARSQLVGESAGKREGSRGRGKGEG
jgi:PPK2 family polyphosphate:nucleotide phosphotransferase